MCQVMGNQTNGYSDDDVSRTGSNVGDGLVSHSWITDYWERAGAVLQSSWPQSSLVIVTKLSMEDVVM